MKLSVCLLCINEAENLDRCLTAVKDIADEIVVGVDDKTIDNTAEIAKKFTKKVFTLKHLENFHINKQIVIKKCRGDWILQLDADEVVTKKLADEILQIINNNPHENGFWINRLNFFLGKPLRKGGAYPDPTMRLYRRDKGQLQADSVHEQATVEGKTGTLNNYMEHYGDPTFWHYIKRFNRYTDLEAKTLTGGIFANFLLKPLFDSRQGFITIYIRHLGFLDGFAGFVWALFSALHFPVSYLKFYESRISKATN